MRLAPKIMIEKHTKFLSEAKTQMEAEHHYRRLIEAVSYLKVHAEEKIRAQDPESDDDKE